LRRLTIGWKNSPIRFDFARDMCLEFFLAVKVPSIDVSAHSRYASDENSLLLQMPLEVPAIQGLTYSRRLKRPSHRESLLQRDDSLLGTDLR
jgi:hypothetical protein